MACYETKYTNDADKMAPFVRHLGKNGRLGHKIEWPFPNARPMTSRDFWHHYTIYSPTSIYHAGHMKIEDTAGLGGIDVLPINSSWASVVFFAGCVQRDSLLAVVQFYAGPKADEKIVEYYEVSICDHDYRHESGGNCYHIYTCKKCGHRYDVDSSD